MTYFRTYFSSAYCLIRQKINLMTIRNDENILSTIVTHLLLHKAKQKPYSYKAQQNFSSSKLEVH